jgi:serine/threonine protein kinase
MDSADRAQRWQGQRSSFSWEQSALDHVREQMPLAEPYRAWQTFTFTASTGHVREIDLFIATPGGLFLVEVKSHPGIATNSGSTWIFRDGSVTRTIENPLHFTDQKAKELRTLLQRAAPRNVHIPFIGVGVFLSAETLQCRFDEFQLPRVYGRDGIYEQTRLPGIWRGRPRTVPGRPDWERGLLDQPPRSERDRVDRRLSEQLPDLMQRIGIARLHKAGKVGPYELAARSFGDGPTYEDYLATNPAMPDDQPRRVRVYLAGQSATEEQRQSTQRAARREYSALQGITHEGIVAAEQYSDELIAGPAVVFRHGRNWRRLDHFLAAQPSPQATGQEASDQSGADLPIETRVEMIRQLAEALDHAHRRHLYHRALAPRSVYVELDGRYPRLRIADWQVAAHPHNRNSANSIATGTGTIFGSNALIQHVELSAGPYLAPELNEPTASSRLLDVFGLGALSYLIMTGQPPAEDRTQLAVKLNADRALIPSAIADSISPQMDDLVREATQVSPRDRLGSVREFVRKLDQIEAALTDPQDRAPVPDPLQATKGDVIEGWTVVRTLGKGTTSKALLVTRDGEAKRVFKVALDDRAAERLKKEAQQLAPLADSHVARLLDGPLQSGPPGQKRWIIAIEYVDRTLQEDLRKGGPLAFTINQLERFGEDLFQALTFLDRRGIWHRDIKPENIGLRLLPERKKGRELVLFDFSLAGAPDTELGVGTKGYLDPFLGSPSRQRYDQAAELYAAAVTLHEMASGELPAWGDEIVPVGYLPEGAEPQLAEDVFDQVIRDGLVRFLKKALHRDAAQRYGSLHAMKTAWMAIFAEARTDPPASTSATIDALNIDDDATDDDEEAATALAAKRDAAAASATADTPLGAAGLSGYALSIARRHLAAETVADLAAVPTREIQRMPGIGRDTRKELIARSQQWRQQLRLSEGSDQGRPLTESSPQRARATAGSTPSAEAPADHEPADPAERLAELPVDEVARRLAPLSLPLFRQATGLDVLPQGAASPASAAQPGSAALRGTASQADERRVAPWASRDDVARALRMTALEAAMLLEAVHARWTKSVPGLDLVRDDVAAILREHGRVMGLDQLAVALLVRRGSAEDDPAQRLREAALCVRAAIETEERRAAPRMLSQRQQGSILIALTSAEDDAASRAEDLFACAELLGEQADALAARDPLPGVTETRQALREVLRMALREAELGDSALWLSDTDLVQLAAAASRNTAANARLELYPRDLPADRAMRIAQVGSLLGRAEIAGSGVSDIEYVRRVLARFPDLVNPPNVREIPDLLTKLGYSWERDDKLNLRAKASGTHMSSRSSGRPEPTSTTVYQERIEHARARLAEATRRGGFIALRVGVPDAAAACDAIAAMDGVRPVNVAAEFVRLLREVVAGQGRPSWDVVLAADTPGASPAAKSGFAALVGKVWDRLETQIRATSYGAATNESASNGHDGSIVFLHDATPLARYAGGSELLARLAVAARDAGESPHGLWLLCPMGNPGEHPNLDGVTVGVIPGDAEQLYVPPGFADDSRDVERDGKERQAS